MSERAARAVALGGGLLVAVGAYGVNVRGAVEFDLGEVKAALAARNVVAHGVITWGSPLRVLVLAFWAKATGNAHGPLIDTVMSDRYLGAALSVLAIGMVGLLALRYRRDAGLAVAAMLLAMISSGRTDPTAALAGLIVVYLALRLRTARPAVYVGVVGIASGLALLLGQPLVVAPALAALLARDRPYVKKACAALLAAALIWGVNRPWTGLRFGGKPDAGGYLVLALGVAGLLWLAWQVGLFRGRPVAPEPASLIAYAGLSYALFAAGVTGPQLIIAALPAALGWGRKPPRLVLAAGVAALIVGVACWVVNVPRAHDDATTRMGTYVTAHFACVPIAVPGEALRWTAVLPRNPLQAGAHLYVRSDGTPAAKGRRLLVLSSRTYKTVELWEVPGRATTGACVTTLPAVGKGVSSRRFLALLLAVLVLVGGSALAWNRWGSGGTAA